MPRVSDQGVFNPNQGPGNAEEDGEERCEMLSPGHAVTMALDNTQKLWLPARESHQKGGGSRRSIRNATEKRLKG